MYLLLAIAVLFVVGYLWFSSRKENMNTIVLYHTPWCGYCKRFKPTWQKLKDKHKNMVKFVDINCEKHKDVCKTHEISSYPTIRLITNDGKVVEYDGDRSEDDLLKFISM